MTHQIVTLKRARGGVLKAVGENRAEGYLVRFTPPEQKDLVNERFDRKRTDFMFDRGYDLKGKPIKLEHGFDGKIGAVPVGIFDLYDVNDIGVWVEGKLREQEEYEEMLRAVGRRKGITLSRRDIRLGGEIAYLAVKSFFTKLKPHWSSGAFAPGVIVDEDGTILQWPIDEGSGTVQPAEPDGTEITATLKSENPALKALMVDLLAVGGFAPGEPQRQATPERTSKTNNSRGKTMDPNEVATEEETEAKQDDVYRALQGKLAEMSEIIETIMGGDLGEEAGKAAKEAMEDEMKADLPDEEESSDAKAVKAFMARLEAKEKQILQAGIAAAQDAKNARVSAKAAKYAGLLKDAKNAPGKSKAGAGYSSRSDQDEADDSDGDSDDDTGSGGHYRNKNIRQNRGAKAEPWKEAVHRALTRKGGSGLPGMKSVKAQNPYVGPLGGDLVGQELATQILEPLRPKVVCFNAGVRQTSVSGIGIYTVPRMTTAPQAYRPGINTEIDDSEGTFDAVTAFLRPIAAKIHIPRQLLAQTQTNAEQVIRDQSINSIRLQIDKEILIGVGTVTGSNTGAEIRGVLNTLEGDSALAGTNIETLDTNGRQPNYDDLVAAETQLYDGNVEESETWGWIMNPRTRGTYRSLTDKEGRPLLFDNYGQKPYQELIGYKVSTTTQVPRNLEVGTNSDNSLIFLGDWQYGEYVMGNDIEIIVDEVTLAGQLMIRIIAYTFSDFILHYPQAFYVMKGVRA